MTPRQILTKAADILEQRGLSYGMGQLDDINGPCCAYQALHAAENYDPYVTPVFSPEYLQARDGVRAFIGGQRPAIGDWSDGIAERLGAVDGAREVARVFREIAQTFS